MVRDPCHDPGGGRRAAPDRYPPRVGRGRTDPAVDPAFLAAAGNRADHGRLCRQPALHGPERPVGFWPCLGAAAGGHRCADCADQCRAPGRRGGTDAATHSAMGRNGCRVADFAPVGDRRLCPVAAHQPTWLDGGSRHGGCHRHHRGVTCGWLCPGRARARALACAHRGLEFLLRAADAGPAGGAVHAVGKSGAHFRQRPDGAPGKRQDRAREIRLSVSAAQWWSLWPACAGKTFTPGRCQKPCHGGGGT